MFSNKVVMEVKGNEDRVHRFECDPTAPLGEVHDALTVIKAHIVDQINAAAKADSEKEECGEGECKESCESQPEETKE